MPERSVATLERKLWTAMLADGLEALRRELKITERRLVRVEDVRERTALTSHFRHLERLLARFSNAKLRVIESVADEAD